MIKLLPVNDDDSALAHSPMVRAIGKICVYIEEHGSIGLTASKAFKRVFVRWAVTEFDWPDYTIEDLYGVSKILNERDFLPLLHIREMLLSLKIAWLYKGDFHLTRMGRTLTGHPGKIFGIITPFYLQEFDHMRFYSKQAQPRPDWDVFLNALNIETETGASGAHLRQVIYGQPDPGLVIDDAARNLYLQVLRPLCWTGLLTEEKSGNGGIAESLFQKTPLWRSAVKLDTDSMINLAVRD